MTMGKAAAMVTRTIVFYSGLFCLILANTTAHAGDRKFNLADDIGLSIFGVGNSGEPIYSADGKWFAVATYRGRLDLNKSESTLRLYRTEDVYQFLVRKSDAEAPSPVWTVRESTYVDGPIITDIRWTDSDDVAFLCKTSTGGEQLLFGKLSTKIVEPLTPKEQDVTAYDIRSRSSFVYTVLSPAIRETSDKMINSSSFVATGMTLSHLLFPILEESESRVWNDLSELWVYTGGQRVHVSNIADNRSLPIHRSGQQALSLSPDGRSVVTALSVAVVPPEWEALYPPAAGSSSPYRNRGGAQDVYKLNEWRDVTQYVLVDVPSGRVHSLTQAPIGGAAGWWGVPASQWSPNGRFILLSNTFLKPQVGANSQQNVACVAVDDLEKNALSCLQRIEADQYKSGARVIERANFAPRSNDHVIVHFETQPDSKSGAIVYAHTSDGRWAIDTTPTHAGTGDHRVNLSIVQDMDHPPVLVANLPSSEISRQILDPNPQLRGVQLAHIKKLKWKDKAGREWIGGLYEPPAYEPGKHYPLIIQTHGFYENRFIPSGIYTTAFAAQELASSGFVVLQVRDCPIRTTPEEGACNVDGYESVVHLLAMQGLIDPQRVGIIGFSRTCFYVLQALTTSALHFGAASITDGINEGYFEYLTTVDEGGNAGNAIANEANVMIGAPPVGEGLQQWLKRSPEFNMEKVTAPLLMAGSPKAILYDWEPYAMLRYLNKPVDLIALNSDEHVLTNPGVRVASQGSNIDWFRFWLQGYEDPDPTKVDQYKRWEHLRELQEANNKGSGPPNK